MIIKQRRRFYSRVKTTPHKNPGTRLSKFLYSQSLRLDLALITIRSSPVQHSATHSRLPSLSQPAPPFPVDHMYDPSSPFPRDLPPPVCTVSWSVLDSRTSRV